jgi:hypothetical protein
MSVGYYQGVSVIIGKNIQYGKGVPRASENMILLIFSFFENFTKNTTL